MTDNSITNQASIMAESISQFYKRIEGNSPELDITYLKGKAYFNIFSRRCNFGTVQFSYRDFYKVTLIRGEGKLYYADKWIQVDRPALLFSNPLVPYAWESLGKEQKGMFCIFNEQFVQSEEKNSSLANTPLFKITGDKVFFLDESQLTKVQSLYTQMQEELQSAFVLSEIILLMYSLLGQLFLGLFFLKSQWAGLTEIPKLWYFFFPSLHTLIIKGCSPFDNVLDL